MLSIRDLVFAVLCVAQVKGTNIMLNKPSTQSGTSAHYSSKNANDGKISYPSITAQRQDPYWQGDLQGFYTVSSVSVSSAVPYGTTAKYLKKAIVGGSAHGVDCSGDEVTRCGQWPDQTLVGHTIVFNCTHIGPARFVKIWREGVLTLSVAEVKVKGQPSRLTGTVYNTIMLQKVTMPTTSLSVTSVTGCISMCYRNQSCLAFSHSRSEQPNCLLSTDVTMTSDMNWVSYNVSTMSCFKVPTCNLGGLL